MISTNSITANVEYMASSRTQMMNKEININKSQIASKMPDMAICYIHCQAQLFMENIKKLYRVTLRGMTYNSTGVAYGSSYVIAENSDEAYQKVRKFLDENDLGFTKDRELDKVELIADSYRYTDVGCLLHL